MSMRKTKKILRMKWVLVRSHRETARALEISLGAVTNALSRAETAGLDCPQVELLTEDALEQRLYTDPRPRTLDKPLPASPLFTPCGRRSG
jgi:hypothetical protein